MNKFIVAITTLGLLTACGGDGTNPFSDPDDGDGGGGGTTPVREMPPGTANPTTGSAIERTEPDDPNGSGYAEAIAYDEGTDTFFVDNLAFDAANTYTRGVAVGDWGPYQVYESAAIFPDSLTGNPINQFTHRAIYGISPSKNTEFAIVRTGAYVDYGFGGFIYKRSNGVVLPDTGQAIYTGKTAGLVDYQGRSNLDYSTGDIEIAIDFEDFNEITGLRGDGVTGTVTNRRIYDINGTDITNNMLSGLETEHDITLTSIPTLHFVVGPGVMDDNGEILGSVTSSYRTSSGANEQFEGGKYYAIVSGNDAEEIVGVIVIEGMLSQPDGAKYRDTSGFIVYR